MVRPDLLLTNTTVHTLTTPDETAEAVAVRDGVIDEIGSREALAARTTDETTHIDCEGGVVLPGFIDAHTHMESTGRYEVHADLSETESADDAVDRLSAAAADHTEWALGFGYDESEWPGGEYLTRDDLDRVSETRPVAAVRVDMHTASLNSVALERLLDGMPDDVRREDGTPTGVVVEDAVDAVWKAIAPDRAGTRRLLEAARDRAHECGVTAVHDMVRRSHAPRVYREMAAEGVLDLRVRLNYWSDHLGAVQETGLRSGAGDEFVQVGAIKSFTDGSIGARTAKLSAPYEDTDGGESSGEAKAETGDDGTGTWVVSPAELREIAMEADEAGLQLAIHAIGDVAIEETVSAFEECTDPRGSRHRVEHVELATDDHLDRMAEAGIVASCQPNFLRWARPGGLYDQRLGEARRRRSNRFRDILDAGVALAFGSDSMPMDPLLGVHHAVNAPVEAQRLSVTEALRAYTRGAAMAGFDEDRLGTLEPDTCADLVVLDASPWEQPDAIDEIAVESTIVDGRVVFER